MQAELSKLKYCKGIQCPKMLWMDMYMPQEAKDNLPETVMETGQKVGELARSYFGKYELVDFDYNKNKMADRTRMLLEAGAENIAEASFYTDGLYCSVDILHRDGDGFDIIEVKSSTHVTDIYIEDVSFQYYVLSKCGINVGKIFIMYLDNTYVRHGELDVQGIFAKEDCTDIAKRKYDEVEMNIRQIRDYLSVNIDKETEPVRNLDMYCERPYPCAYYGYCGKNLPEESIFSIRRLDSSTKYEYYHDGIITYEDIIRRRPKLSDKQMQQVETAFYDKPDLIKPDKIQEFLATLYYPLYHLDFETFQQAIPEFDGLSPYVQIPFQYSLHIEYEDGRLEHREFLAKEGTDPRRAIAESLCKDFPTDVCVLAYNMQFERTVLKKLAETFPDLSEHLMAIRDNIKDLMIPFQKQYYYSKAMKGSYSIKYVLPALYPDDPELDYHSLEGVHHGGEASATFADLANHTPEEIEVMRHNLLNYCGLDTYAMVKVLQKLREACE